MKKMMLAIMMAIFAVPAMARDNRSHGNSNQRNEHRGNNERGGRVRMDFRLRLGSGRHYSYRYDGYGMPYGYTGYTPQCVASYGETYCFEPGLGWVPMNSAPPPVVQQEEYDSDRPPQARAQAPRQPLKSADEIMQENVDNLIKKPMDRLKQETEKPSKTAVPKARPNTVVNATPCQLEMTDGSNHAIVNPGSSAAFNSADPEVRLIGDPGACQLDKYTGGNGSTVTVYCKKEAK